MKRLFFLVLMLGVFLQTSPSYSDDIKRYIIPDGIDYKVNGVEGIFFTKDEYKVIGLIYADYNRMFDKKNLLDTKYELRLDIEEKYELGIENCKSLVTVVQRDVDFWKSRSSELGETINSMNKTHKLEKVLYWVVIGLLSVADVVVVVHDAVE